jgi:hypothetical protein
MSRDGMRSVVYNDCDATVRVFVLEPHGPRVIATVAGRTSFKVPREHSIYPLLIEVPAHLLARVRVDVNPSVVGA